MHQAEALPFLFAHTIQAAFHELSLQFLIKAACAKRQVHAAGHFCDRLVHLPFRPPSPFPCDRSSQPFDVVWMFAQVGVQPILQVSRDHFEHHRRLSASLDQSF
jgi:hypothetical protein